MRKIAAAIVLLLALALLGFSSSRQVAADTRIVEFPRADDAWNLSYFPLWCVVGDNVSGTREIGITRIDKVEIHLILEYNTVSDAKPLVFNVSLNGKVVATFSVGEAQGLDITVTSDFEPIETEGSVVIDYKLIKTDGGGIIIKSDGSSTLTLSDGLPSKTKRDFALQALGKLEDLRDTVDGSDIKQGSKHSLLSKLDNAIAKIDQALVYIDKGDEQRANNKLRIAKNSVLSFIRLADDFSERMGQDANTIIELIEMAIKTPI